MRKALMGMVFVMSFVVFASFLDAARADSAAEATYKSKCQACHGPDGKGETPAGKAMKVKDFASPDVVKISDAELAGIIQDGKGKMPGYGKSLKPEQVKELVAYIRALGKK